MRLTTGVSPGFLALVAVLCMGATGADVDDTEVSTAVEDAVKNDLAKRLDIPASEARLVKAEERVWPDRRLGCPARRDLQETAPVPGYRIVLGVGERTFVYHTDREGEFVRCDKPKKPLDRIK